MQSLIADSSLSLRSANVRVVHLGCPLETRQSLREMRLEWADHHKHERLGVPAQ